jgi:hypothetical protein
MQQHPRPDLVLRHFRIDSPRNSALCFDRCLPSLHDALQRLDAVVNVLFDDGALVVGQIENGVNALARSKLTAAERTTLSSTEEVVQRAGLALAIWAVVAGAAHRVLNNG